MVTVIVPPALPATLSIGISFAIYRLRQSKIFCIQPNKLNMSAIIQTMVFDKTGTLTEEGLQIVGTTDTFCIEGMV